MFSSLVLYPVQTHLVKITYFPLVKVNDNFPLKGNRIRSFNQLSPRSITIVLNQPTTSLLIRLRSMGGSNMFVHVTIQIAIILVVLIILQRGLINLYYIRWVLHNIMTYFTIFRVLPRWRLQVHFGHFSLQLLCRDGHGMSEPCMETYL